MLAVAEALDRVISCACEFSVCVVAVVVAVAVVAAAAAVLFNHLFPGQPV